MKHLICTLAAAVTFSATMANAAERPILRLIASRVFQGPTLAPEAVPPQPIPEVPPSGDAYVAPGVVPPAPSPMIYGPAPVGLYPRVVYKDRNHIHPCAVPTVIQVPHPCPDPCVPGPQCVAVEICAPPCGPEHVKVKRFGRKIKYDYGDYAVEVSMTRRGIIEVDYDD